MRRLKSVSKKSGNSPKKCKKGSLKREGSDQGHQARRGQGEDPLLQGTIGDQDPLRGGARGTTAQEEEPTTEMRGHVSGTIMTVEMMTETESDTLEDE